MLNEDLWLDFWITTSKKEGISIRLSVKKLESRSYPVGIASEGDIFFFFFKSFNLWRLSLMMLFIIKSRQQLIFGVGED